MNSIVLRNWVLCALFYVLILSPVNIKNQEKVDPSMDTNELLKIEDSERDKLLACTELVAVNLQKDEEIIKQTMQTIRTVQQEYIQQKITGDMINQCYYSIQDSDVHKVFFNGVFQEPEFSEKLLVPCQIDYSKYNLIQPSEFELTPETQILFMKLEKVKKDYLAEQSKAKMEAGNSKGEFKISGYSLRDIPKEVNLIFLIVVISLFFGLVLYFLKHLMAGGNRKNAGIKKDKNKKR